MKDIQLSIKNLDYTLDLGPYIVLVQKALSSFDEIFDSLSDDEVRENLWIKQTREKLNSTILKLQDIENGAHCSVASNHNIE